MNSWQKRRRLGGWSAGTVEWVEGDTAFLSVVFSWDLAEAYQRAVWLGAEGYRVRAGGPAVALNPDYLRGVAEIWGEVDALWRHNPRATRATTGCIRCCPFCAVPRIEGGLRELADSEWEPKPLECSNNLLAASVPFFDHVIDRYLDSEVTGIDFNQGLDARLLTEYHARRLAELHRAKRLKMTRLAWDRLGDEVAFRWAHTLLREAGIPARKISVYVLIGFGRDDTPEEALYRLREVWALSSWPSPMRYQPLDATKRNEYVAPGWSEGELRRYVKYWSNLRHLSGIPFEEFRRVRAKSDGRPGRASGGRGYASGTRA